MRRVALLVALAALLSACSASGTGGGDLRVVAAENFWGSIATQLAGTKASVQSIIVNPAEDPHSYEPTAADARKLATSRLAIFNGVAYDPWAPKLLAANPVSGRVVLDVGKLLHLHGGDNPHRWYSPADVGAVARAITADLIKLDGKDAAYFERQRARFERVDLAAYHGLIADIRARYAGVPVGASESIFAIQAPALGLNLITPYGFLKAISEGTDLTAAEITTAEHQITSGQIKVWIYNSQNATPEVQRLTALARTHGIPVVTITETLAPASGTFEQWQVSQLRKIEGALHAATGR